MVPAARKKNKIASGKKKNDHYSYFFILQQRLYIPFIRGTSETIACTQTDNHFTATAY